MDYRIELQTLTPIWTGNIDRQSPAVRETGLIGSLRWWFEIVIRGLGGDACDPTEPDRCVKKPDANICPVCELFGCTGWGRKFHIKVESPEAGSYSEVNSTVTTRINRRGRPIHGLMFTEENPLTLRILPVRRIETHELVLLEKTLRLIEQYGGLGAGLSQGNGVVKIIRSDLREFVQTLPDSVKNGSFLAPTPKAEHHGPRLDEFAFGEYTVKFTTPITDLIPTFYSFDNRWKIWWDKHRLVPMAPHIRDTVRRSIPEMGRRHQLFGFVKGQDTQGSRVFVSHGYDETDDPDKVCFRLYMYDADASETKAITDTLTQFLEQNLFDNGKKEGRLSVSGQMKSGAEIIKELSLKGTFR